MAFHAFAYPVDYCLVTTARRTNFVFDSDTVGGAVRIYYGYKNGPHLENWDRLDDATSAALTGLPLDVAPPVYAAQRGTWQGQPQSWGVISNQAYLWTASWGGWASQQVIVNTDNVDVDVSCPVKTTTGNAGLIMRSNSNGSGNAYFINSALGRVQLGNLFNYLSDGSGGAIFTGTTVIIPGTTYTLRCTVVGNLYTMYVNGVLEGSVSTSYANTLMAHGLWATDTSARFGAPFQMARNALPLATAYELRNYDGDILASGSVTDDHIDFADSVLRWRGNGPYGWYRFYLTGPNRGDGQWQTAYGDCSFYRIRTDTNFAANVGNRVISTSVSSAGMDQFAHAVVPTGTVRFPISSLTTGTVAGNNAATLTGATYLKTNWIDAAYSTRPRTVIGAFQDGTTGINSTISATVALLKNYIKTWEPRNEPYYDWRGTSEGTAGELYIAGEFDAFRTAVKAGDATARVVGPGPVTISGRTQLAGANGPVGTPVAWLGFIDSFLAACMTRGGTAYLDGLSVHVYNNFNGDLNMARRSLADLKSVMANRGYTGPIYQTEQGYAWLDQGWQKPRHAGRWTAVQWLLCELYGLPVENNFYWYDQRHGFDAFPMYWIDPVQGPGPQALPIRVMSAELANRTLTAQIDFGTYGNMLYAGGTWAGADGSKTVGLMAGSPGAAPLTLSVLGISPLICVDPWGNTFSLPVTAERATFPVSEMLQWVRVPPGGTVTVIQPALGTNLALAATPAATGSQTNLTSINDGITNNQYGDEIIQYLDTSGVFPQTITLTFPAPVTANRVIVYAFPPWQPFGTLTNFDVDTFDGTTWTTRYTQGPSASKTFAFTSVGRCTYESFWEERYVFDVAFPSATITKVRVVVRACSRGDTEHPTLKHDVYGASLSDPDFLTIQEIQVFNSAGVPAIGTLIRNPAMGGVLR